MTVLGTAERPLRVAIVGSGPSGFYAAEAVLKAEVAACVSMFEQLPTPFGLVRGGVAPDHAKIKNVTRSYAKTAAHEDFSYYGNIKIGRDLTVAKLQQHYDAIIIASGAETDRHMNIAGEELAGSHTATEFIAWYNGHPDYRDHKFDLSCETAVVIGAGNVAMDVCRILSKTVAELKTTDIAQHALEALGESKIRKVYMVARRGPAQAKFSPAEIKELREMTDCEVVIESAELDLNAASEAELAAKENALNRKNVEIMKSYVEQPMSGGVKQLCLRFLLSPTELHGNGRVEQVTLEKNSLAGDSGKQHCVGTGETFTLDCGLLFRSIGYRGVAIPGVPFHEQWGVIPHAQGRITDEDGVVVDGLYTAGWIKRGPSGVIGTNKACSVETVQSLLADLPNLPSCSQPDDAGVAALLESRGVQRVTFADWQKIDAAEIARGEACGKPREKFTRIAEMLAVLDNPVEV